MQILVIQTAFLGDVILATPVLSELKRIMPTSQIDILVRKGNEGILANHPDIREIIILDKKAGKLNALRTLVPKIRKTKYTIVINLHRFAFSGLLTSLSGAPMKIGFNKNPFSLFYTKKVEHVIGDGTHEVERNLKCIAQFGAATIVRPSIFPSNEDHDFVSYNQRNPYVVLAPASVWFTKQLPLEHWSTLARRIKQTHDVFVVGGPSDQPLCAELIRSAELPESNNLAGKLTLLQSAALFQKATRCYVNDSGPLHIASAVNAPTTAFFCATVPNFGFGPLSSDSKIIETEEKLSCRPCGLHGGKTCPKGHFKCGDIDVSKI